MKRFRRPVLALSLIGIVVCIVLLLNITAPNPTGRRYSATTPTTTGEGSAGEIGISGERALAQDLNLPRNENPDQRQCFCNATYRNAASPPDITQCRTCITFAQMEGQFRRPDFVAATFIAEAKNRQSLLYSHADQLSQIGDYAISARAIGRPLWLYVRVDTRIDPEYIDLAESTGGGVVFYFTVPGYTDPVDRAATIGLAVLAILFALTGVLEFGWLRGGWPGMPRRSQRKDPATQARDTVDDLQAFKERSKDRAQRKVDREDARGD